MINKLLWLSKKGWLSLFVGSGDWRPKRCESFSSSGYWSHSLGRSPSPPWGSELPPILRLDPFDFLAASDHKNERRKSFGKKFHLLFSFQVKQSIEKRLIKSILVVFLYIHKARLKIFLKPLYWKIKDTNRSFQRIMDHHMAAWQQEIKQSRL